MKLSLSIFVFALTLNQLIASTNERFTWHIDLDQARLAASINSKPMLIVFRCEP